METTHRGDLAILHIHSRIAQQHGPGCDQASYRVALVTSITRTGEVKAVRDITGPDAIAGATRPIPVGRLPRHSMIIIPASRLHVANALAAILALRSDPGTGYLPAYDSPVELLRDLIPHHKADPGCLAVLRNAAYRHVEYATDQRCGICGVCGRDDYRITTDADGCPMRVCREECPIGVSFTTDYPIGLKVRVVGDFADGMTTRVEHVRDNCSTEPGQRPHYASRTYWVCLPGWGFRSFLESYLRPADERLTERYTVRRDESATQTTPPR
jgi:hypothetical protein